MPWPDRRVICRTLCRYLLKKRWSSDEIAEETAVEFAFINAKKKVVTADNRPFEVVRNDPVASQLRVDLRDQEFADFADLLLLRLDLGAGYSIAKNDPSGMQLHSASLV